MGSRLFAAASSHRSLGSSALAWTSNHTQMALVTVTALPGAGVRATACSVFSATSARNCALQLDGDNSGSLACLVGTSRVVPSTLMIPTADGRWYFIAASKATGTVTVRFYMYDFIATTWTIFNSTGTIANRTGAAQACVGGLSGADFWDGRIAAAMHRPRLVNDAETQLGIGGKMAWRSLWRTIDTSKNNDSVDGGWMVDMTQNDTRFWSENIPAQTWSGTPGPFDALSTPPGW